MGRSLLPTEPAPVVSSVSREHLWDKERVIEEIVFVYCWVFVVPKVRSENWDYPSPVVAAHQDRPTSSCHLQAPVEQFHVAPWPRTGVRKVLESQLSPALREGRGISFYPNLTQGGEGTAWLQSDGRRGLLRGLPVQEGPPPTPAPLGQPCGVWAPRGTPG